MKSLAVHVPQQKWTDERIQHLGLPGQSRQDCICTKHNYATTQCLLEFQQLGALCDAQERCIGHLQEHFTAKST
eukprot:1157214-Pelagomonas_calceolata.AAC.4